MLRKAYSRLHPVDSVHRIPYFRASYPTILCTVSHFECIASHVLVHRIPRPKMHLSTGSPTQFFVSVCPTHLAWINGRPLR
ncbi:hypothetical protein EMIT0P74_220073 [Pseudomonas sp. IT-P74]